MANLPAQLLQSLYVFSQSQTMSEAAAKLGLSQPGLTKQLQTLEEMLPQELFTTSGKSKVLTAFGLSVAAELAPRFGGLTERLSQIVSEHSSPELATVRIAGRREILDRFSDAMTFPGRLVFSVHSNTETAQALINREIDFGVTWMKPDSHDVVAKKLFTEQFQVVIPKTLMRAKPSVLKPVVQELLALPCLTYKADDEVFTSFTSYFGSSMRELNIKRTTANYQSLVRMIESGLGWSMVPVHYAIDHAKNWILPVPEAVGVSRQFYICYRTETAKLRWSKLVTAEIETCFRR